MKSTKKEKKELPKVDLEKFRKLAKKRYYFDGWVTSDEHGAKWFHFYSPKVIDFIGFNAMTILLPSNNVFPNLKNGKYKKVRIAIYE